MNRLQELIEGRKTLEQYKDNTRLFVRVSVVAIVVIVVLGLAMLAT